MTSHSRVVVSPVVASVRPSGLNVTDVTVPVWPAKVVANSRGWRGSFTFHSRAAPSVWPVAMTPPGRYATHVGADR
ncbi:hypothetical protein [Streptomyces sp. NBC_01294]|uniref:hypothetical protein n=1 Tax=Streptomyces sp. NBC_01294 TaxID=2903815 RepID=UPI002DDC574B|nr:hypothetical protein [Streptomyces sp. NBC_01294]WRZ61573.1 hypothetical protein OG534_36995 [Streptomyces sp. NBC_01294]